MDGIDFANKNRVDIDEAAKVVPSNFGGFGGGEFGSGGFGQRFEQ